MEASELSPACKKMCVCVCVCLVMSNSLWPWNVPGKKYWGRLPLMTPEESPRPRDQTPISCTPALAGKFFATGQIDELIQTQELLLHTTPWSQNLGNTVWVKARHERGIPMTPFYTDACLLGRFSYVWLLVTVWTVCSLPDSSVHGILQARILEWIAMPSSRESSQPRCLLCVTHWRGIFYPLGHLESPL